MREKYKLKDKTESKIITIEKQPDETWTASCW